MSAAEERRGTMVERQLRERGIDDERVLAAMGAVPREAFVPAEQVANAYRDAALPIGSGQTISQPWIVAAICSALELEGGERVLEVGTGSGYSAAVLAHLAGSVVSLEIIPELASAAIHNLDELPDPATDRIVVVVGDGSVGYPLGAPYDAIAVHAATPGPPRSLLSQLRPGGRLVAPIVEGGNETLTVFERDPGDPSSFKRIRIAPCRFVPLTGAEGRFPA